MVVLIYPIAKDVWSFREQDGEPVRVEVPKGSELLEVRTVGLMLFVPNATFPFIRGGWNPRQTIAEAGRLGGRFKFALTT